MKIKGNLAFRQKKLVFYLLFSFFYLFPSAPLYSSLPTSIYERVLKIERLVTGTVTDQHGEPLIRASILIKGTNTGTETDNDGNFSLQVPENIPLTLVVSYIGYTTQEIELFQENQVSITLIESISQLEELIVVGYGTQNNSRVSAAIEQVEAKKLEVERRPVSSLESALIGTTPGLILESSDGQFGSDVNLSLIHI